MEIKLTPSEMVMAGGVGLRRQISVALKGYRHRGGRSEDEDSYGIHIEGAMAEYAVAKALNVNWNGSVDTFKRQPDLCDNIQVRSTTRDDNCLIFRETDDKRTDNFVLVTGKAPNLTIRGWIYGAGIRNEWLRDGFNGRRDRRDGARQGQGPDGSDAVRRVERRGRQHPVSGRDPKPKKLQVNSPNHTVIYIPSGPNGVPLVNTIEK